MYPNPCILWSLSLQWWEYQCPLHKVVRSKGVNLLSVCLVVFEIIWISGVVHSWYPTSRLFLTVASQSRSCLGILHLLILLFEIMFPKYVACCSFTFFRILLNYQIITIISSMVLCKKICNNFLFCLFSLFPIVSFTIYLIIYLNVCEYNVHVSPIKMHRQKPRVLFFSPSLICYWHLKVPLTQEVPTV